MNCSEAALRLIAVFKTLRICTNRRGSRRERVDPPAGYPRLKQDLVQ
jgi:hypothetical protein